MYEFMYGRGVTRYDTDPHGMRDMMLSGMDNYEQNMGHYTGGDPVDARALHGVAAGTGAADIRSPYEGKHDWDQIDELPGWVVPWQNSGEGILPDLSRQGESGTTADLLDEGYFRDSYTRMSAEALVNSKDWIGETKFGLDPNLLINGIHMQLGDRNLNDKAWDPPPNVPIDYDAANELEALTDEAADLEAAIHEQRFGGETGGVAEQMRKLGQQGFGVMAAGALSGDFSGQLGLEKYGSVEEAEKHLQQIEARKKEVEDATCDWVAWVPGRRLGLVPCTKRSVRSN